MRKPTFWILTWSNTNQDVQLQKMARGLNFRIWKVEELNYLCRENKGADQLRGYHQADLLLCFRIYKMLLFSCRGSIIISCLFKLRSKVTVNKKFSTIKCPPKNFPAVILKFNQSGLSTENLCRSWSDCSSRSLG